VGAEVRIDTNGKLKTFDVGAGAHDFAEGISFGWRIRDKFKTFHGEVMTETKSNNSINSKWAVGHEFQIDLAATSFKHGAIAAKYSHDRGVIKVKYDTNSDFGIYTQVNDGRATRLHVAMNQNIDYANATFTPKDMSIGFTIADY
jgi:hypothetical protein